MFEHELVHSKEKLYFTLVVIVSILIYLSLLLTIVGIISLAIGVLVLWILHIYSMMSIRKNAVRLSEYQFPEFYKKACDMANRMGMEKIPDIYVMESGGFLNAFATKSGFRNMVVLYSDVFALIEAQAEEEVMYILAHEFAHIKRRHVGYFWLFMPGLKMPFLGKAYSRACEYTCDRYGAYFSQSYEAAKNALTVLAIGPKLYSKVNQNAFVQQMHYENEFFSFIEEILSTHPSLPNRLQAIEAFFQQGNTLVEKPKKNPFILISVIALSSVILIGGGIFAFKALSKYASNPDNIIMAFFNNLLYDIDSMNELMVAVMHNDLVAVEELIDDTALDETNKDGYTAVHIAVIEENAEILEVLLAAGSPTDTVDVLGSTPLMEAVTYNDVDSAILLLQYGASPTFNDSGALKIAQNDGNTDLVELLESYME